MSRLGAEPPPGENGDVPPKAFAELDAAAAPPDEAVPFAPPSCRLLECASCGLSPPCCSLLGFPWV